MKTTTNWVFQARLVYKPHSFISFIIVNLNVLSKLKFYILINTEYAIVIANSHNTNFKPKIRINFIHQSKSNSKIHFSL